MMINKALHETNFMKSKSKLGISTSIECFHSKKTFILTLLQQYTQEAVLPQAGPVWSWTSLWGTARTGQPRPLNELQRKNKVHRQNKRIAGGEHARTTIKSDGESF